MRKLAVQGVKVYLNTLSRVQPDWAVAVLERLFSSPKSKPFSAQDHQLLAKGETQKLAGLATTLWGHSEKTVLLVHGWQHNRAALGAFVEPLVKAGFRAVAFDAPAHGDSAGNRAHPAIYSEKIREVGHALGQLHGVIAHSMGGGSTVMALSRGLEVNKVALLAPAIDWEFQIRSFTKTLGLGETLTERFVQQQQSRVGLSDRDSNAKLFAEHLDVPARIYHDPEERRVPVEDSQALLRYWREAELIPVAQVGHGRILVSKKVVENAVAFLSAPLVG